MCMATFEALFTVKYDNTVGEDGKASDITEDELDEKELRQLHVDLQYLNNDPICELRDLWEIFRSHCVTNLIYRTKMTKRILKKKFFLSILVNMTHIEVR